MTQDETDPIMEHVCDIISQTPNISVNEIHALMPTIERRIVKKATSKAKKNHQACIDTRAGAWCTFFSTRSYRCKVRKCDAQKDGNTCAQFMTGATYMRSVTSLADDAAEAVEPFFFFCQSSGFFSPASRCRRKKNQ